MAGRARGRAVAWSLQIFRPRRSGTIGASGVSTMSVLTRYTPPGASRSRGPENAHYFLMNCLLYSRMECGFPSNDEYFDEDVNVYLAGLLVSLIAPGPLGRREARLPADDASLAAMAAAATARERYELYRANADHLLVSLGVFGNARARRPDSAALMHLSDAAYVGRGKAYYALAQSYAAGLARRATAVSDCLGKLSRGFERYLAVLSTLRGEYLNLHERISDGALYHLERSAEITERRGEIAFHYDRFLDVYSHYLRTGAAEARERLAAISAEIRAIDPSFSFNIGKREPLTSP